MKKLVPVLAVVALLLAGVGVFAATKKDKSAEPAAQQATATSEAKTEPTSASKAEDSAESHQATAPDMTFESSSLPKEPMGARTLGDPKAPVKIEEFASLTCGHCAHFEATTFPELKKKYIDTGKVFFTFTDFPLNAPALDAAMIARCLPPERYFPFIVMLFGSQDQWAFTQDYKTNLRQNAKLAGMSDEKFDSCLADKALQDAIVKDMQERGQKHDVQSTPSFLVNGKIMSGALPIEAFDQAIEDAMKNTGTK